MPLIMVIIFLSYFFLVTVTLKGIKLGPCGQAAAMLSKSCGGFSHGHHSQSGLLLLLLLLLITGP